MSATTDRYGVDFVYPTINYRERDGEPSSTFEEALSKAKAKAELVVTASSGRIKIHEEIRDDNKKSFIINLGFVVGGQLTGSYIEVSLVPPAKSGLAVAIRGGLEELGNSY